MNKKSLIILIVGILLVAGSIYLWQKDNINKLIFGEIPRACTQEAKICPDGSSVGRTGPNCEFAPCPKECVVDPDCYPPGFVLGKCGPFYTCGSGKCYEGSHACPRH